MNSKNTSTDTIEVSAEDVVDPEMIPGGPLWNPVKFFKTRPMVTVFARGDRMNPQFVEDTLSINGHPWTFKYDQPEVMPTDYAAILVGNGRGQIVSNS